MKKLTPFLFSILVIINVSAQAQPALDFVRVLGGPGLDGSKAIKADALGNVYTVGTFADSADLDTGPGVSMFVSNGSLDIFILKLDSLGNLIWSKRIGGAAEDIANGLVLDATGNLYLTGSFGDTVDFDPGLGIMNASSPNYSAFILKMDPSGSPVWLKTFDGSNSTEFSGGFAITLDNSGNVICTGTFYGTFDFDPGAGTSILSELTDYATFLLKLTNTGSLIFAKKIVCTEMTYPACLKTDPGGNIYACGYFIDSLDADPGAGTAYLVSPDGYREGYVSKYSSSGSLVWTKALGTHPFFPQTWANALGLDASGNVYVCGSFSNSCDFDPGIGVYNLTASGGDIDVYSVKLDNSGNFIWAQRMGGEDAQADGMFVDASGNQTITGLFLGTMDCDPSGGTFNLYSNASFFDVFTMTLNSSGSLLCAFNVGSTYHDYGYAIDADASSIYMTGVYSLTCDFDPGAPYVPNTSNGNVDVYIAKYEAGLCFPTSAGIEEEQDDQLSLFPNPFSDQLNILWAGEEARFSVYNSMGEKIINDQWLISKETNVDFRKWIPGIYFVVISTTSSSVCQKVVKR